MSKKLWIVMSLLVVAAMMLVACGGGETATPVEEPTEVETQPTDVPAEPPPAEEETTISIWHQWSGDYLDAISQAFADYEAANPGVKIMLDVPEDVSNALDVAIPAGEGPDIIGWANDQIGAQALVGNIVALDEYGIDMAMLESTYTDPGVVGVVWNDMIWGLPETMEGIAMLYNMDLVTEDYLPADPMDFEDLYNKAAKFQEDTGKVLICNQGFGANDAYHVAPIYFGHGVPSYVDDQGNAYLNTPEAMAAGDWLAKIADVSLAENSHELCLSNISDGSVGLWWSGPWAINSLEENGVNYGIAPMGSPFVGIKVMMLSKNAVDRGNTELAIDIMKYFTSPEVQKALALVNKTIPAQTAAIEDPEVQALPTLAGFGAALSLGTPMSNSPFSSAQWDPVGNASAAIYTGAQEVEEALNAAQAAIEEAIALMQ